MDNNLTIEDALKKLKQGNDSSNCYTRQCYYTGSLAVTEILKFREMQQQTELLRLIANKLQ